MGVSAKRTCGTAVFDDDVDDGWNASETDPVDIPCPECGHAFHHDAWTLVNARQNPELVEQLLAGKLFEFTCPECGYTASLVNPCLFLDPAHGACVYLVINDDMAQGVAGMFAEMDNDDTAIGRSLKRIVRDRHQLKDKAALLDAGLDDRAIEVLKTGVTGQAKMQGLVAMDETCEAYFEGIDEGGDLIFEIAIGETSFQAVIPRDGYELFADAIMRSSLRNDEPYYVDRDWAHHAIDVFEEEGVMN